MPMNVTLNPTLKQSFSGDNAARKYLMCHSVHGWGGCILHCCSNDALPHIHPLSLPPPPPMHPSPRMHQPPYSPPAAAQMH